VITLVLAIFCKLTSPEKALTRRKGSEKARKGIPLDFWDRTPTVGNLIWLNKTPTVPNIKNNS
jgi:hypothetical protein